MIIKEAVLLLKYIFIFLFLIFIPMILYILVINGEGNIFILVPTSLIFNVIVSLTVPYIEIKFCQSIANKYANTILMKLLSTYKVPVFILLFFILLDIALPIFFVKMNDWLFQALLFYTGGVSFSGSFLPAFMMSIAYKNVMSKNFPEFYDESNNFITIISITILTFCCKFIGMGIFIPLHIDIYNFFAG